MTKMRNIGSILDSVSITHKFDKDKLVFLNTSDVLEGKILINKYVDVDSLKGQAKKSIKNDDILFSEIRPKNKRYAYVKVDKPEDYVVSTKLMVLRNKTTDVLTRYVYYFLTYEGTLDYLQMRAENRIGSFPQITFDIVKVLELNVPDLETQQKIVDVIFSIDSKIEVNNQICAELESMAKSLFSYWFVQFDFPDRNGKPYKTIGGKMVWNNELKREVPIDWQVEELRNYLSSGRGISYNGNDLNGTGAPMINLNSFNINSTYKPEGIKRFSGDYNASKVLKPLDLVMCNTQQTALDPEKDIIGKSLLVPDIFDSEVLSSHHVTTIRVKKESLKYYLNSLFNTEYFHRYISGYATGTNILGLNFEGVLSYKTTIPPDYLLAKYKDIIINVERQRSATIKENQKLTELRAWILPMLMSGQIKVSDRVVASSL